MSSHYERQVERSRERILEAAEHVVAMEGIGGASVEEIVARAGVAKSTLYRHWPGRDELMADVVARQVVPLDLQEEEGQRIDVVLEVIARELTDGSRGAVRRQLAEAPADGSLSSPRSAYVTSRIRALRDALSASVGVRNPQRFAEIAFAALIGSSILDRPEPEQVVGTLSALIGPQVSNSPPTTRQAGEFDTQPEDETGEADGPPPIVRRLDKTLL